MKKICVIGMGYIGLPTSAMFSRSGIEVVGVDVEPRIIDVVNNGSIHIEEPGLEAIVKECVNKGTLRASLVPEKADAYVIAVPTPNNNDALRTCNYEYVLKAIQSILPYITKGNLIIIESTIGPRATRDIFAPLLENENHVIGDDVFLAHCPERVLPGNIINEMINNNRVIGGYTKQCALKAAELYRNFVEGEIIETDCRTAEMAKLIENTYRDINIAFANELAIICNSLQINVNETISIANKHPRVNIHNPGPGVGGHCLAVDPYFICEKAPNISRLIQMAREINNSMPSYVIKRVEDILTNINDPKISVFGLAYKGNVDDIRESPSIEIIDSLIEKGYQVNIYDPHIESYKHKLVDYNECINNSDMLLVLTDHNEFKDMDFSSLLRSMRTPIVFDTKGILGSVGLGVKLITLGG